MAKTIWKVEIKGRGRPVSMPVGALVLDAQVQLRRLFPRLSWLFLYIWFECDPDAPREERVFKAYGTGSKLPDNPGEYVRTFQLEGGALVFHLYEATNPA